MGQFIQLRLRVGFSIGRILKVSQISVIAEAVDLFTWLSTPLPHHKGPRNFPAFFPDTHPP